MAATNPYTVRKKLYREIAEMRGSKVLAYVSGDRRGMETRIHPEVLDLFTEHLDQMFPCKKISLLLYTRGGSTLAAWTLVNLLRMFCDDLEVIVGAKAHSAGTLLSLGANRIVMTKQATLGPIDPSFDSHPLAPLVPGAPPDQRAPVSVEAVQGYFDLVQNELKITDQAALAQILIDLSNKVHPLVLGQILRTKKQIQFLADELLNNQVTDKKKKERIIKFLSSESGSHDYTINRREAATLGLNIEKASDEMYGTLSAFHASIVQELELDSPFDPAGLLNAANPAQYKCVRCVIESSDSGSHTFVSEGTLRRVPVQIQPGVTRDATEDERTFEGWRKR